MKVGDKLICIEEFGIRDYFKRNNVHKIDELAYNGEIIYYKIDNYWFTNIGSYKIDKYFITLAEFREKRINKILE